MTYDAGVSRGKYELDISQMEASIKRATVLYASLAKAQQQKPAALPAPTVPKTPAGGTTSAKAAIDAQKLADAQAKAATSAQRLATEQQRTAVATTGAARADQQLARDTANAAAAQDRAAQAALRRAAAEKRAAQQSQNGGLGAALPRTFAGFTPQGLGQAAGAFGLATIGPQLVGQSIAAGIEAGRASLALDRTLKLTRELTGTQTLYNNVIKTARTQQELYGGSLQENIAGIQGLVVTARSTGAELNTLINLSQRLAVLDPAQGAEGARIALSEVLSGDPRSLARRYEIPLSALQKIKDESIPVAERLLILDKYLAKIGITSEVAANSVSDQAKAFNRLSTELGDLQTNTGRGLADAFAPAADGLSRLIGVVNGNPEAIAKILALRAFGGSGAVGPDDVERQTKNLRAADVIDAQAAAGDAAFARDKLTGVTINTDALEEAKNRLLVFGASSDEARDKVIALYAQFRQTGDYQAFISGARQLEESTKLGTKAIQESGEAIKNELADKVQSTIETEKLTFQQAQLEADSIRAANGLLGAGDQALLLAEKYGIATSQAQFLIDAQSRVAAGAGLAEQRAGERAPRTSGKAEANATDEARQQQIFNRLAQPAKDKAQADALRDANELAQSRARLEESNAITAEQKIALARRRLNQATSEAERNDRQADLNNLLAQQDKKARTGGGTKPGTGLSGLTRTSIELAGDEQAQLAVVNAELSRANLTAQQRNQLELQRRDLIEQIADEEERATRASIDARLGQVQDAQKRLKEAREAAGLQRQLQSGRFSEAQQQTARLRLEEISLEQQKRALDIQKDVKTAGGAIADTTQQQAAAATQQAQAITQPLPLPNLATLPPVQAGAVNLSLTIQLDPVTGQATVVNPPAGVNLLSVLVKSAPGG